MAAIETNRVKIVSRLTREGEHDVYRHKIKGVVSVPRHRSLSIGVARSIAKAAGWL
jgi:predicted RNA binding protein YcfA (HicA-like mRNA interferase family)